MGKWAKNMESNPLNSFDGVEICELVGLYLLDKLSKLLGLINVDLYRYDRLALIKDANGPKLDHLRKDFVALSIYKELFNIILIYQRLSFLMFF